MNTLLNTLLDTHTPTHTPTHTHTVVQLIRQKSRGEEPREIVAKAGGGSDVDTDSDADSDQDEGESKGQGEGKDKDKDVSIPPAPPPPMHLRQLSGRLVNNVVDHVDAAKLQDRLLAIAKAVTESASCDSEDDCDIVECALGLWVAIVVDKPSLLSTFLSREAVEGAPNALFWSLMHHPSSVGAQIRKAFIHSLHQLCLHVPRIDVLTGDGGGAGAGSGAGGGAAQLCVPKHFQRMLVGHMPCHPGEREGGEGTASEDGERHGGEYEDGDTSVHPEYTQHFELLCKLIGDAATAAANNDAESMFTDEEVIRLFDNVAGRLMRAPILETHQTHEGSGVNDGDGSDSILVGLLSVGSTLVDSWGERLLRDHVYVSS